MYGLAVTGASGRALGSSHPKDAAAGTANANAVSVGFSAVNRAAALATAVNALTSAGNWAGSTPEVWAMSRPIVAGSSGRTPVRSSTGVTTFAVVDVAAASAATKIVSMVAAS